MQIRTRLRVRGARSAMALALVLSAVMAAGTMVANAASSSPGAHLSYYGGKVISSVNVVQVIYGPGTYLPATTRTTSPSVSSFFRGVTNSTYFDWLSEYNTTPFSTGTNQTIGRGSFGGMFTISPDAIGTQTEVDPPSIEATLSAAIQKGQLPGPQLDATGNPNTLYAIFLPHELRLCVSGQCSDVNGFCAYHGAIASRPAGVSEIYYSVQIDLAGNTNCGTGNNFENTTSVASHELLNAVTDPEFALAAQVLAAPVGWFDNTNGEIADICNGQQGNILGGDGVQYMVQKGFSNQENDCVLTHPPLNDFSIGAAPQLLSIQPGNGGTTTIMTTLVSGSQQTVTLGVSGQRAGVTASLQPGSVSAGGSASLAVSVSAFTPPGSYNLNVTGANGAHTHVAEVTVKVPRVAVRNGGFETGSLAPWKPSGPSTGVVTTDCHSGTYCARVGSTTPTNGSSSISQTFFAPGKARTLSMWYKQTCAGNVTDDWALVTLRDDTTATTTTILTRTCVMSRSWTNLTASVTPHHIYTLTLTSHDDNVSTDPTYTLFDDVTLQP